MASLRSAFRPPERHRFGKADDIFELGRELASGSQGRVYVCTRLRKHNKEYGVKIVNTKATDKRDNRRMVHNLNREIAIMRELHHPRIVNLLEAFWEGDLCFVVMDLAQEGDLHSRLKSGRGLGPEVTSRGVFWQFVEAIGYMHTNKVIHRDLKPENVLVTRAKLGPPLSLSVKIADFGLSRVLKRVGEDNLGMTACGTMDFLAPEVITGNYDERVDLWSLGVMLFMMLCGDYPFEISGVQDLQPSRLKQQRIRTKDAWHLLSADAQDVVRGLLVVEPDDRLSIEACMRHRWLQEEATRAQYETSEHSPLTASQPSALPEGPGDGGDGFRNRLWRIVDGGGFRGVVSQIGGRTGNAVDNLQLQMWEGEVQRFGGQGGSEQLSWHLHHDEAILAVSQETRQDFLGNSLAFYLSSTRIIRLQGHDARNRARFAAPVGSQVTGLQFTGHQLTGLFLERHPRDGSPLAVASIGGRVGSSVDVVVFGLRDGGVRRYGGDGGDEVGPWMLADDEFITAVEQGRRDAYLGYSFAFLTSAGNVIELQGMEARAVRRFIAPLGSQICGLTFEGSLLSGVSTVPWDCPREKVAELEREHNAPAS